MKVILGNSAPHDGGVPINGPTITETTFDDAKNEDGSYVAGYIVGTDADEVKDHLIDHPGMMSRLPGNEAILNLMKSWPDHGMARPSWVSVEAGDRDPAEAEDFERFCSDYWHIPRGAPADLEETHHTHNGPPGEGA